MDRACRNREAIENAAQMNPYSVFSGNGGAFQSKLSEFVKAVSEIEEKEIQWLIDGYIPSGNIVILASDGGIGKTTIWIGLAANLTAGRPTILDPPGIERPPKTVMFFSGEDSVEASIKPRLLTAGANEGLLSTIPNLPPERRGLLKFGEAELHNLIREKRPDLCIFDPIQAFLPPKTNMGARNEMRDLLAPLISLGDETGTAFLIVCHTNKRKGASGRDRIADSADLWDIARSVLMVGFTEENGIRYLSHEKSSYGPPQQTILFRIDEGQIVKIGQTWKRDRDYQGEAIDRRPGKKDDAKNEMLNMLQENGAGKMPTNELDSNMDRLGFSHATIRRAKEDLKNEGKIHHFQEHKDGKPEWFTELMSIPQTYSSPAH